MTVIELWAIPALFGGMCAMFGIIYLVLILDERIRLWRHNR